MLLMQMLSWLRRHATAVFLAVVFIFLTATGWGTSAAPTAWLAPQRARIPSAPYPGVYQFQDKYYTDPTQYPVVGTHRAWRWFVVEPREDDFRWDIVEHWLSLVAAQGKIAGLGVNSYDGIYAGGDETPRWVYRKHPATEIVCPGDWRIPRFWDPAYQAEFEKMVASFARHYDGDPRLAWVEISVGVYGETQPAKSSFYDCLQANGLTSELWVETVNRYTDIYLRHFHHTQLFLQMAPAYKHWWERREFSDYAASRGVGLKHNGLWYDQGIGVFDDPNSSDYGAGYTQLMRKWGDRVPIAWEGQDYQLPGRTGLLWGVFNALDKHADYILFGELITKDKSRSDLLRLAQKYLGRTLADTPSVWVALRETEYPPEKHPQRGNFSFWLYQKDDVPGGRSVPLWNVGPEPEGRFTRRTDQATGNGKMYFDVDDGYIFAGNALGATIDVTYLDQGSDRWSLYYDSRDNTNKFAGTVQKTNSGLWRTASFSLPDAYFANRQPGHADFHIDSLNDGDEVIHFVQVVRLQGATATPTPTRTPTLTPVDPTPAPPTPTSTPVPYHVLLQNGLDGYKGCQDTAIYAQSPGQAHGIDPTLGLRALPSGEAMSLLLRFELSGRIPQDAAVKEAHLYLFATARSNGNRLYPRVYSLLRPWSEASATWNQASSGHLWHTPGAAGINSDRGADWSSQAWLHSPNLWYSFDVTELVAKWVWGRCNFGVILVPYTWGKVAYQVASSDNPVAVERPKLEVIYDLPGAATPTATPTVVLTLPPGVITTATPTPTPTITPTPTVTPTSPPPAVLWQISGRVEDVRVGFALQLPVTVTIQFGSSGLRIDEAVAGDGTFSGYAVAPDDGALHYDIVSPAYEPCAGVAVAQEQRQYQLSLRLYPRRPGERCYAPWVP